MDRRKLHKSNGQRIGKNKEISRNTRAAQRLVLQDAHRSISPDDDVVALPSRMDRLKAWRTEREEKKKREAEAKKKPFVSVVKRGVFLDQTNYTELNKLRRRNNTTNKVKPSAVIKVLSVPHVDNTTSIESRIPVRNRQSVVNAAVRVPEDDDAVLEGNTVVHMPRNVDVHVAEGNAVVQESDDNAAGENVETDLNATFELPKANNLNHDDQPINSNIRASSDEPSQTNDVINQSFKSPTHSSLNTSLNYVSPFVTFSRGKGSAHKEVKVRESLYKLKTSQSLKISPVARQNREAAAYFRFQVSSETEKLMQLVDSWDKYKNENDHVDSVYLDQIDVAIGQTKLLIAKKFKQFSDLINQCEEGSAQPPVLPEDLEGFWSMVFMQVENCNERFQKLQILKENDWVEDDFLPVKVLKQTKNRKVVKKEVSASSGIQKMIEEARIKMKQNKISSATGSSNSNSNKSFSMTLRQTPARLSLSNASAKTPKSIIKVKTPGVQRNTKSVAFAYIDSPATKISPKMPVTPKHKAIKRRASTSGVPSERESEVNLSFSTPQQVANDKSRSNLRRSHRRLFSVADK